jgi:hypothetical protein
MEHDETERRREERYGDPRRDAGRQVVITTGRFDSPPSPSTQSSLCF